MAASAPALPVVRAGLARALFFLGRTEEAGAVYETLRSLPATGGRDTRTLDALIYILDMIVAFGDTATAQATYDLFGAHVADFGVTGTGVVFLYGSVHWPLGRLAALLGHTGEALDHYAAAVTINTRIGARPFVALSRLGWADVLRGRGASDDHAMALLLAGLAAAEARRLDMPAPCRRADQLIHKLQQAIKTQDPLTRREHQIAELVSAGLSKRAIADTLVLSERTVEGHVTNTLAKLQLANRTELTAWVLRSTPAPRRA